MKEGGSVAVVEEEVKVQDVEMVREEAPNRTLNINYNLSKSQPYLKT